MTPIQQMFLGLGAASKTYVDDVFSTYLYDGNAATQVVNNGIDLSGEGGLVWIKTRSGGGTGAYSHVLTDTERGPTKYIYSNLNWAEDTNGPFAFNNNGFNINSNSWAGLNSNILTYSSWTFRKAPGFCDVVQFSGNSVTNTQISHNLGSNVGMVMVKSLDSTDDWAVWHRDIATQGYIRLNTTDAVVEHHSLWGTSPARTSTYFTVGTAGLTNQSGQDYIAYVFAGGASTAATATSNGITGAGEFQYITGNADYAAGTNDFTVECWVKPSSWDTGGPILAFGASTNNGLHITRDGSNSRLRVIPYGGSNIVYSTTLPPIGEWTHVAVSRASGTTKIFINGTEEGSASDSTTYVQGDSFYLGYSGTNAGTTGYGKYSNVRFVNGTAVYTSSFRPLYEPLTNITNTKLLFAQGSTTTSATVIASGGVINDNGTIVHSSTDSPFDDPEGFKFGGDEDQNTIKTGSYIGNGSTDGPEVFLGWEPQWVMWKNSGATGRWFMADSMRGITTEGQDATLKADGDDAEYNQSDGTYIDLTPTGFKINGSTHANTNANNNDYVYIAIRRSDGYVGKPPELGTDAFAMDVGNDSSAVPMFDSGFPVDFGMFRMPGDVSSWWTGARLTQGKRSKTNSNDTESSSVDHVFDSNEGWYGPNNLNSSWQSWMWKRGQGFDVVTYSGDGVNDRKIPHSLNKTVEMIWLKVRDHNDSWIIGHKGLDGGTNPWEHNLYFDGNSETDYPFWNDTAPTSTHFTIGSDSYVNHSSRDFIAMLFASVNGISKVGSFDGSSSDVTITTGFTPRFIIIRSYSHNQNWCVFDTLRSLGSSGNDQLIKLNASAAQSAANTDYVNTTATGFVAKSGQSAETNGGSTYKYIYYAHA
jgi:hypothetical protein